MTESYSRVQAAEAVASRWTELGISFVVAHGIEDYPLAVGRDLDILMDPRHADRALHEARQTLAKVGWPRVVCPPRLWGARLVALTPDDSARSEYLEFHTAASFAWLVLPLVTVDVSAKSYVGPFPTDPWTTFAKAVMLPLLAGDTSKLTSTYLKSTWHAITATDEIERRLTCLLGAGLALELLDASRTEDAERLASMRSEVRRRCVLHMLTQPATSAFAVSSFLRKRLGRFLSDSGARVRVSTPAEMVAHDLALEIAEALEHVFVVIRVGRPGRWPERLAQRYNVLSRQGLVLEVEDSSRDRITLTMLRGARRVRASASYSMTESPEVFAGWIVDRWAHSLRCR